MARPGEVRHGIVGTASTAWLTSAWLVLESPAIEERDSANPVLFPLVYQDLESPAMEEGLNFSDLAGPDEDRCGRVGTVSPSWLAQRRSVMKEEGTVQPWTRRQSFPGLYCPEKTICGQGRNSFPAYFPRDSLASGWPAEKGEAGSLA